VVHVPTERDPEFINEIFAHIRLGISGRGVSLFVLLEVGHEFAGALERRLEV